MKMSKAFRVLEFITARDSGNHEYAGESRCKDKFVTTLEKVENDYYSDKLPFIPAGTVIQLDFGGDFGFYGVADINGVLHKIKVHIHDLHKIDFSDHVS
jgi:hypothetical protein